MYRSVSDAREALAVWSFEGRPSKEEWAKHIQDVEELKGWRARGGQRAAIILAADDAARPDARQRSEISKILDSPHYDAYVALVSSSALVRGVLTALRWVRSKPYYEESTHADFDSAVAWLERKRGGPLPVMKKLIGQTQEQKKGRSMR